MKANTAAIMTNSTIPPPTPPKSMTTPFTTAAAVLVIATTPRFPIFITDDVVFIAAFFVFKRIFFFI